MANTMHGGKDLTSIIKFAPDNFTPLSRTPWAGSRIAGELKKHLIPGLNAHTLIGESWEFSSDKNFPSRLDPPIGTATSLLELFKSDSPNELLVKLIDAADPLSLQLHPRDDDPDLTASECGKPESWYVIDAAKGSGLYLGFSKKLSSEELRKRLSDPNPQAVLEVLQFVPVAPGDYFEIRPGVAHAIGPGVLLLEPQRCVSGKSGKTFRMWDWGRTYDADGNPDPVHGKPRELHIEASLRVLANEPLYGIDLLNSVRRPAEKAVHASTILVTYFPANPWYQVVILQSTNQSEHTFTLEGSFAAVINIAGSSHWKSAFSGQVSLKAGNSALWPQECGQQTIQLEAGTKIAVVVNRLGILSSL